MALAKRRIVRLVFAMIVASSVSGLLANGLRVVAGRTRPHANVRQGWYGPAATGHWIAKKHKFNSFPSAHTASAAAFAAPVLLVAAFRRPRRWLLIPGAALPLLVGWSRLYLGVHHFSDVVFALLLGVITGVFIMRTRLGRPLLDDEPAPSAEGTASLPPSVPVRAVAAHGPPPGA